MWSIGLKNLRANLSRFVATLVAIAVGVGFLTAATMITNSIEKSLGGEIDEQYAGVDLAVQTKDAEDAGQGLPPNTFPADVVDAVDDVVGIRAAAAVTIGNTKLPAAMLESKGDDDDLFEIGPTVRTWIADTTLNPLRLVAGAAPRAGEVTVDRGIFDDHGVDVGDKIELATVTGLKEYRVSGVTEFGTSDSADPSGTITAVEPDVFGLAGYDSPRYSEVLISVASDASATTVRTQVADAIAATPSTTGLDVVTGARYRTIAKGNFSDVIGFLRPFLQGFAGLAIFVCGFVIFNTFSVVVSQRIRELALMAAIAATPRQIRRSLRAEGLGIGLLGSVMGLALGTLLTFILSQVFVALDLDLPEARIALTPGIVITGLLVGTLVTFVAVQVPAFRAGRAAPVEAMRESAIEPKGVSKVRLGFALAFFLVGIGLMLPKNGWLLIPGAPLMVIGVFLLGPALAYWFARATSPILRRLGMAGRLASDNIARNPRRTSTTMNALVIGLLLVTLVTVAGNSLTKATVDEINKFSSADFIIGALPGVLPEELVDRVPAMEGVEAWAPLRQVTITYPDGEDDGPPFITSGDPELLESIGVKAAQGDLADLGDGVAVADFGTGVKVGDLMRFGLPSGETVDLPVTAVLELSLDSFSVGNLVSEQTMDRLAPDSGVNGGLLKVDPDERPAISRELKKLTAPYGNVLVQEGNIFGQLIEVVFSFLIDAINGLLGMSVVIALIGIVNTLTLSVFERRRELGLLRAVGMTAQRVRRMIRLEALQMAILGTIVGMSTGLLLGYLILRASDFGSLDVQWGRMGILFGIGIVIGIIAAIAPTRRVTKLNVLDAIEVT